MRSIAIVGGTGANRMLGSSALDATEVQTSEGAVTVWRLPSETGRIYFLPRHGMAHDLPPHLVRYRANTAALVSLGVTGVVATNAVGSLRQDIDPGTVLVLSDFIDFTRARPVTYYEPGRPFRHTDMSTPYCPTLSQLLAEHSVRANLSVRSAGVYLCTDGPRYESPAEVRLFGMWGADVVGMTGVPEVTMAREAGLCYGSVAIVTNPGAGLSDRPVAHDGVVDVMSSLATQLGQALIGAAAEAAAGGHCALCR
jgi:5'-methylthioadenosine phosphorylase